MINRAHAQLALTGDAGGGAAVEPNGAFVGILDIFGFEVRVCD